MPTTAGTESKPALIDLYRDDPCQHAIYQLRNARINSYPYPHAFIREIFPADYYRDLIAHLPTDEAYVSSPNGRYPERGRLMLAGQEGDELPRLTGPSREFWSEFRETFLTAELWGSLIDVFAPELSSRLRRDCWLHAFLSRDTGGYAISPHTDTSRKLISVLFYLPTSEAVSDCGTSVIVSDRPEHNTFDVPHSGDWDGFKIARTVPFEANSIFAFLVNDKSLHAVKPTPPGTARDTIQFSIMMPD